MTDERMGDGLWDAIERVPRGGGIVFRHYGLESRTRKKLFLIVSKIARRRRLLLVLAGSADWPAAGRHGRRASRPGLLTMPVHNMVERIAAERAGADLLFCSPVFATSSHNGQRPLGRVRFGQLIRGVRLPIIALGGMTAARAKSLRDFKLYGWAAIDAWMDQNLNAVPT